MGLSRSPFAYAGARNLMDEAFSAPHGLLITLPTRGKAINLRQQCYTVRRNDRELSTKRLEPHDPGYGWSNYDALLFEVIDLPDGRAQLRIEHQPTADKFQTEEY